MLYCDSLQLNNSCVLHSLSLLLWVRELTRDLSHDLCYKESQDYKGICRVTLWTLVIWTDFLYFIRLLNKNEEFSSFFPGEPVRVDISIASWQTQKQILNGRHWVTSTQLSPDQVWLYFVSTLSWKPNTNSSGGENTSREWAFVL